MRAVNVILIMLCLITISGRQIQLRRDVGDIVMKSRSGRKKKFPGKGGPNLTTTTNIIMYDFISSNISLNS